MKQQTLATTVMLSIVLALGLIFQRSETVQAADNDTRITRITRITRMGELNPQTKVRLLDELAKERAELQGVLLTQLSSSQSKETRSCAAFLLGLYRMEQAVNDLAKLITMEADIQKQKREAPWGRYPVVEALIRIGRPGIPAMLENIEKTDDELVRKLSARVIRFVEGPDIAKFVLEEAIRNERDTTKKQNLQSGLTLVLQESNR